MIMADKVVGFWAGVGSEHQEDAVVASRFQGKDIIEQLYQRVSSVVIGPRQSGKTTLLKQLVKTETVKGRIKPVYLSLEGYAGRTDLTDDIFWSEFSTLLYQETLKQEIPEPVRANPKITVFRYLPQKVHLFIDEFTFVAQHMPTFFHRMRSDIEHGLCTPVVLADRAHPNQYAGSGLDVSPFNLSKDPFYLQDLTLEESTDLLARGIRANDLTVDNAVFSYFYDLTSGQPYLTNRLGELSVQLCKEEKKSNVTIELAETAVSFLESAALSLQDPHFDTLYSYLTKHPEHSRKQIGIDEKDTLLRILNKEKVFFEYNGNTGVLHTYGFIRPESVRFLGGMSYSRGSSIIRNKLYETFLQHHKKALQ